MKRHITVLLFCVGGWLMLTGQEQHPRFEKMLDEYQNERVAFLTRQLDLTPAEAEKFWPIYNEYLKKRDEVLRERRPRHKGPPDFDQMTDQELDEMLKLQLDSEIKLQHLKKEYFTKIRKELSARKVAKLYMAEQQFMNHMINRFREPGERGRRSEKE